MTKPFLVSFAEALGEVFPELNGRSLAVADAEVTKENIPTLPVALVSLIRDDPKHPAGSNRIEMSDRFTLEFWYEPIRYRRADGTESPYWAFYDYDALRKRVLAFILHWRGAEGDRVYYAGLEVEAKEFGVSIVFYLIRPTTFCLSGGDQDDGAPLEVDFTMTTPLARGCVD